MKISRRISFFNIFVKVDIKLYSHEVTTVIKSPSKKICETCNICITYFKPFDDMCNSIIRTIV